MNALVEQKTSVSSVGLVQTGGGQMLAFQNMAEVVRFAEIMARGGVAVPKHLRDNPGACLAVTMQAARWEMDPFSVANNSYSVSDRLAYEAKLIAAVVNTRAPIRRRPDYSYDGTGDTRTCTVSVEMKDGSTKVYTTPPFGRITPKNSPLWKTDPDQQQGYFAIRSWARRYAPEVILGVYDRDELDLAEPRDVTPPSTPADTIAARLRASQPQQQAIGTAIVDHVEAELSGNSGEFEEAEVVDGDSDGYPEQSALGEAVSRINACASVSDVEAAWKGMKSFRQSIGGEDLKALTDAASAKKRALIEAAEKPSNDGWGEDDFPGDRA